jgi:uncharacterized membrane protein YciS (DUF1049 family)
MQLFYYLCTMKTILYIAGFIVLWYIGMWLRDWVRRHMP